MTRKIATHGDQVAGPYAIDSPHNGNQCNTLMREGNSVGFLHAYTSLFTSVLLSRLPYSSISRTFDAMQLELKSTRSCLIHT